MRDGKCIEEEPVHRPQCRQSIYQTSEIAPIVLVVEFIPIFPDQSHQFMPDVLVVRLVLEFERQGMVENLAEAVGQSFQQLRLPLLLDGAHQLIGLHQVLRLDGHPGQLALEAENQAEEETLHLVPAAQVFVLVALDSAEAEAPTETLHLPLVDVLVTLQVTMAQLEVDHVQLVPELGSAAQQKVARLDVAVQEPTGVQVLETVQHLQPQHEGGLEREPAPALSPQLLQVGAQLLEHDVQARVELEALLDLGEAVQVGVLQGLVDLELVLDGVGVGKRVGLEDVDLGSVGQGGLLNQLPVLGFEGLLAAVLVLDYLHAGDQFY